MAQTVFVFTLPLALLAPALAAQTPAPASPDLSSSNAVSNEGGLSRWLTVDTLSLSLRYRSIYDSDGVHTSDQAQQRSLFAGSLNLDSQSKYTVNFRLSSGRYFDWAYADFMGGGVTQANQKSISRMSAADRLDAIQSGPFASAYESGGWAVFPRQFYFDARPVNWLEAQYGSLGINRGVGTEITSYDEDGYISGGRLQFRKPEFLYFDEVSVTYAYLGDIYTPNFFDRYSRLTQSNYHQFLVRKKLNRYLEVSTDYTWHLAHTLREAAYVKTKEFAALNKVADGVRFEAYQRLNALKNVDTDDYPAGSGYAVTVDKKIGRKLALQAGFADIDYEYDVYSRNGNNAIWAFALNGDQYGMGKRPFARATVRLTPYLSLFGFYTHLVDYDYNRDGFVWNHTALNAGLQVDFKNLLHLSRF